MKTTQTQVYDETPLKWPEGYGRTLIDDRKTQASWKKTYSHYREAVIAELTRMGVSKATITRNDAVKEKLDPGVAVWFLLKPASDFSWQTGLHLDNPAPSLEEIDSAYRRLVQKHHPDAVANGSGGDVLEFHKLTDYRKKARAWVLGDLAQQFDNCIQCDGFKDARQNLAAIRGALAHIRGLERLGIRGISERIMSTGFKAALPQKASESTHGAKTA
jgi:hypothetical protein